MIDSLMIVFFMMHFLLPWSKSKESVYLQMYSDLFLNSYFAFVFPCILLLLHQTSSFNTFSLYKDKF